jgi:hypothetical protein
MGLWHCGRWGGRLSSFWCEGCWVGGGGAGGWKEESSGLGGPDWTWKFGYNWSGYSLFELQAGLFLRFWIMNDSWSDMVMSDTLHR